MNRLPSNKFNFLGTWVDLVDKDSLVDLLLRELRYRRSGEVHLPFYVLNHNLNSLNMLFCDPLMKRLYEGASVIHADGFPVLFKVFKLRAFTQSQFRVTYLDFIELLLGKVETEGSFRVLLVGGLPDFGQKISQYFRHRWPGIKLFWHTGYFINGKDEDACREYIIDSAPDILFVGMGMPKQERFISSLEPLSLKRALVFNCGACFEYLVGYQARPPRAFGGMGLEWLYRLFTSPKRLFFRYFANAVFMIGVLFRK